MFHHWSRIIPNRCLLLLLTPNCPFRPDCLENTLLTLWEDTSSWERKWQPTPVFLPGKSHGRRSLVGYSQSVGSQRVGHGWATSLSLSRHQQICPNTKAYITLILPLSRRGVVRGYVVGKMGDVGQRIQPFSGWISYPDLIQSMLTTVNNIVFYNFTITIGIEL